MHCSRTAKYPLEVTLGSTEADIILLECKRHKCWLKCNECLLSLILWWIQLCKYSSCCFFFFFSFSLLGFSSNISTYYFLLLCKLYSVPHYTMSNFSFHFRSCSCANLSSTEEVLRAYVWVLSSQSLKFGATAGHWTAARDRVFKLWILLLLYIHTIYTASFLITADIFSAYRVISSSIAIIIGF